MTIPKYDELYNAVLECIKDGQEYKPKEVNEYIVNEFNLTEEERNEKLASGKQAVIVNRVAWAGIYLQKAGLLAKPVRGIYQITDLGIKALAEKVVIDNAYLSKSESFLEFTGKNSAKADTNDIVIDDTQNDTADEVLENAYAKINANLADEVLAEVWKLSPVAFEQMLIDLMASMGYGTFENAGTTTKKSGDGGIDGIIKQDKLGFDLIYIQAKHFAFDNSVGRPEVQNFVGAIAGKGGKGLFVTTAKFTKQAVEYANEQRIVLVDGEKLAMLMIEHNFGVTPRKVYEIKTVDTDIFNEYGDL